MDLKIGICGPSGCGKSTLAEYISKEYNIPFLMGSSKVLWDKYGITDHISLINKTLLDSQWGVHFQNELLDYRADLVRGQKEYVTDRTPIDNAVYFLLQNAQSSTEKQTTDYLLKCQESLEMFTHIIHLPYTNRVVLEDDGKRITNKYYQLTTGTVFNLVSQMFAPNLSNIKVGTIPEWDWEIRIEKVKKLTHG